MKIWNINLKSICLDQGSTAHGQNQRCEKNGTKYNPGATAKG
jgi:hypothetical protein